MSSFIVFGYLSVILVLIINVGMTVRMNVCYCIVLLYQVCQPSVTSVQYYPQCYCQAPFIKNLIAISTTSFDEPSVTQYDETG